MKHLVYGVLRDNQHWPLLTGPDDRPVVSVAAAGLSAACSLAPVDCQNPATNQLLRYAAVVEALFQHGTVVPFRYGCLLDGETHIADLPRTRQEELSALLEAVDGCVEMGLRLIPREQEPAVNPKVCPGEPEALPQPGAPRSPGVSYLSNRQAHFAAIDRRRRLADEKASQLRQAFQAVTVRFAADPPSPKAATPLAFHFLVRRGDIESFTACCDLFRAASATPCYSRAPGPPTTSLPSPGQRHFMSANPEFTADAFGRPATNQSDRYEKLYRILLDSIPSSVLLLDSQIRVLYANRNFVVKARVTEEQVRDRPLEQVFPTGIYQQMNFKHRVSEVFRTGEALDGESMVYRAPGLPTRIYYYSLMPFRWKDQIEHVLLLMEDITEKVRLGEEVHRAERHLASVVESASDLVVSMDVRGGVLTWNRAAERVTDLSESEVRHRRLFDLCAPAERGKLARYLAQVVSLGRTNPIEAPLLSRSGVPVPISWVCSPMRDASGRVSGLVAAGRDLTERRKFEAQLLQSEKLAALGVMAGGIAHEIRNPLAVVSAAAQLLLENPLTPSVQLECAEKCISAVQRRRRGHRELAALCQTFRQWNVSAARPGARR